MLDFLRGAVAARMNILVSGGTGAGKTTLLNILSGFISRRRARGHHRGRRRADAAAAARDPAGDQAANIEGKGAVRQRQLVVNALRMRPDRIVVGEVRGEEALDMLQAMNTGHDGSLTTIHANSPSDALYRIDTMVAMANLNIPDKAVRQQVASALNLVIQINRMADGTRKVTSIAEVTGMEQDVITMQEIFSFKKSGLDQSGKMMGVFKASGIRPKCAEQLATAGLPAAHGHVRTPAAGRRQRAIRRDADDTHSGADVPRVLAPSSAPTGCSCFGRSERPQVSRESASGGESRGVKAARRSASRSRSRR